MKFMMFNLNFNKFYSEEFFFLEALLKVENSFNKSIKYFQK